MEHIYVELNDDEKLLTGHKERMREDEQTLTVTNDSMLYTLVSALL